jgi:radical SAM protein with 4Fe4S-binding SPASM domain
LPREELLDVKDTARFLRRLLRREVAYRLVRPTHGLLFVTYRCSSRCTTCTMWKRGSTETEMSLETWKRVVGDFRRAGVSHFEMFGGDALLRPEVLFPLMRCASDSGIPCDLVTNGLLVDAGAARETVLSGAKQVAVSIDGVGDTHDAIRGTPGAFDKAVAAVRNLMKAREALSKDRRVPQIVINCTVSRVNARRLEPLVELAEDLRPDVLALEYVGEVSQTAIDGSSVAGVLPDPYYVVQGESQYLPAEDVTFLKDWIARMHALGRPRGVTFNTENIDVLPPQQMSSGRLPWKSCYVCRTHVILDPTGNVLCCPFFSRYHLGNVTRRPLTEVWGNEKHRAFILAQERKEIAICTECILSVQRNPGFAEAVSKRLSQYMMRRAARRGAQGLTDESHVSAGPC